MAKKTKVGKQRKDKFYKLAKETGYRSRASFKLLQLNRKFEFLPKCRVLVDLCAAPGGWLQVAQQAMPISSVKIGVDLVPIKPIPNVITLQEDITTERCRQALKKELKTWKADVVLHDGAPNVGKNWIQDAFDQNTLTLSALKLASELLVKNGWFITKVFRSRDYLSLVWAFKKLFKQVHVTKPQASRNESAEIFIVCQGYLAPNRIDAKFLDPSCLFKEVDNKGETKANIAQIIRPSKKPQGYENESIVYSALKASDFIFSDNHLEKLCKCTKIVLDDEDIRDHKLTTEEIKQCCEDIKVLGKGELKMLLNWRKQIADIIRGSGQQERVDPKALSEEQEIENVLKEADDLELSKLQEAKRKKKKILKERKKLHDRLNLKMIIKDDEPVIDEDRELFQLSQIKNKKDLVQVEDETNLEFDAASAPPELNEDDVPVKTFRGTYVPYNKLEQSGVDEDETEPQPEEEYSSDDGMSTDLEFESDIEVDDPEAVDDILDGKQNPLEVDLVDRPMKVKDVVDRWFDKDDFGDDPMDNDLELDFLAESFEKKKALGGKPKELQDKAVKTGDNEADTSDQSLKTKDPIKKVDKNVNKKQKKRERLDPEGLALGSLMIQSKKMKRDIIESAYNRYATNDGNLPAWFVEDEKKHYRKQIPVTAEMVREYKAQLREINARPVKKVVEAKARKKKRGVRKMEKARKKAEKITEHPDMSEREKADQLQEIYKRYNPKQEHKVTYVVAKKGVQRRVPRPSGVKGRYKVVDPRMKKDNRKEKAEFKAQKKGRKGGAGGKKTRRKEKGRKKK